MNTRQARYPAINARASASAWCGGHQCQADEFGPGEVRELSVEENEHLGSTLNPDAAKHSDKVHPFGVEPVNGYRADFFGDGEKQLQDRKFEFLSDRGARGGFAWL